MGTLWIGLGAAAACLSAGIVRAAPPLTPQSQAAFQAAPPSETGQSVIGAGDILNIRVFNVEELSIDNIRVDANGHFSYPLLGSVEAAGKSPDQLSAEMADGLRRYLVRPLVTILVKQSARNTVTVIGSVTEAGKFPLEGPTTLIDAIALAKGFTRIADQKQVVILRTINGQQAGALFDMRKIRRGELQDPPILSGDKVVVGINHLEAAWRDALLAAPLLGIFAQLNN